MKCAAIIALGLLGSGCGRSGAHPADAGDDGPVDAPPAFGDPIAGLRAMPGNCSSDGWCWRFPTPNGNDYTHVFGTGADNIWLTGWATVLQWNGATWVQHHPPVVDGESEGEMAFTVTGTSPTNVFLIYETSLEHWDGSSWTILETLSLGGQPGYRNMWADPRGDVWVTYSTGMIKRWHDGVATSYDCACAPGAIWGTSATDIYITTLPAGVLRFDGTTFTQIYAGPEILSGFQGVPNDVWMSGGQSIQHWDGSTLSAVAIPDLASNAALTTMGYAQRNDVWWWASHAGQFVHWDGIAMTSTAVTMADGNAISCGALVDHTYWLAGAYGEVATMDTPFHVQRIIDGTFLWNDFNGIWGSADDDMYFAVGGELRHWDGTTLTTIPLETGTETMLVGLAGIRTQGVDELFVTAYKLAPGPITTWSIFHFDGTTWTKTVVGSGPAGTPIDAPWKIFILGPGEAMAVGLNGYAGYFASGTWQQITTNTTQELTGVFGPDPDHVWVSGLAGTVLRWDRANPTVLTQAPDVVTTADLGPISGSPGDTWIASAATGTMWHNAGSGWTEIADTYLGNGVHLGAVSSGDYNGGLIFSDAMHGWVASEVQNHTFRWNGSTWTYNDLGATRGMPRIIQPAGSKLWAGGNSGVIFHP